jgi:hypothetical protein
MDSSYDWTLFVLVRWRFRVLFHGLVLDATSFVREGEALALYLYDPRTNVTTETNYTYLEELTGKKRNALASLKSKKLKINNINCYIVDDTVTVKQRREWYIKEKFPDEVWKPIDGTEGNYYISNYGRVKKKYKKGLGFLLPFINKKRGWQEIKIWYNGKLRPVSISRLVAMHYIRKPKDKEVVIHKNGIQTDNFSGNLEWVTRQELGRRTAFRSRAREVVKLDPITKEVLGEYRSAREAGRKNYMSYQAVLDCCNKKTKRNVSGCIFMWMEEYEGNQPYTQDII